MTYSIQKRIVFSSILTLFFLTAGELTARLAIAPTPTPDTHAEHEHMIDAAGLPSLNGIMEFDPDLFWRLKAEVSDYHIVGNMGVHSIDFHTSLHDHLRNPPLASLKAPFRILVLGDSCAFGLGVEDKETWPRVLEGWLRDDQYDVDVINAGTPGYTAYQGYQLFQKRLAEFDPDLVLVSFWFNDQQVWASTPDTEVARRLAHARWDRLLMHSRLYEGLKGLLSNLKSDDRNEAGIQPRLAPVEFHEYLEKIQSLAAKQGAKSVFIIWPFASQVWEGKDELFEYQQILAVTAIERQLPVVNLPVPFVAEGGDLFVDKIHASRKGNRLAAYGILQVLEQTEGLLPAKQ